MKIADRLGRLNWLNRAYYYLVWCATIVVALPAQTLTTLHSFDKTDGYYLTANLVQAVNGNLYGTTVDGGANGFGTVFKITPSGALTSLYSFCSQTGCPDGKFPQGPLVEAIDGNLYGVALEGGANGYGTVFKITPSGALSTVASLDATGGGGPAGLVQATDRNFYGTELGNSGEGAVFKMTPGGTVTSLYVFCTKPGCPDGAGPQRQPMQATDGNFYGTTYFYGANGKGGTVFKITPSGALTTLYSFCSQSNCTDGSAPFAAVVQATDGNLYGTTSQGGAHSAGTVFKITTSGVLTTLYSFCSESGCTDGSGPFYAALVQGNDGNLYGTTVGGGANNAGTVFKITTNGALTTMYSFCPDAGCADGSGPQAGVLQDTSGSFYGTTSGGGANSDGTVFKLSVGLGPFVKIKPSAGKVGSVVEILGTGLTGATSVSFNGAPAVFTVIADSLMTATVPAGATSGKIHVVVSGETLSSNVPFRVKP